jgi:4,5-dihydroxyphthalate decarboxylase
MTDRLRIVLGAHGQVADLKSGAVRVEGCDLQFVDVPRMPDAYREMARSQPYDISEMAPTSYLMAVAAGAPITALPIPMTRRFRHGGLQRPAASHVRKPKDLEGRRVGLRTYAVTAAVWTRGIFADEYDVDLDAITWVTAEEENVTSIPLPSNVQRIAPSMSLGELVERGELAAVYGGLAGVGAGFNGELTDLLSGTDAIEADWYHRTGVYPLHGVIVVRNAVLDASPWLPEALFAAFELAKGNYLRRVEAGELNGPDDRRYRQLRNLVGDPLPYGLASNMPSLRALIRYARSQHLIASEPPVAELFHDPHAPHAAGAAIGDRL